MNCMTALALLAGPLFFGDTGNLISARKLIYSEPETSYKAPFKISVKPCDGDTRSPVFGSVELAEVTEDGIKYLVPNGQDRLLWALLRFSAKAPIDHCTGKTLVKE